MDPTTLAALAAVAVVVLGVGLLATVWIVRAAVSMLKRLVALIFVLLVSAGLMVAAILAFAAHH